MAKRNTLTAKPAPAAAPSAADELGAMIQEYLRAHPDVQGLMVIGRTDGSIAPPQYVLTCVQNSAHGHSVSTAVATDWLGAGIEWTRSIARQQAADRRAKDAGKEANAEAPAAVQ